MVNYPTPGAGPENHKIRSGIQRVTAGAQECKKTAQVGPMAPKCAKMEPKSSIFGARKVTFSGKVAESGPVRKTKYLTWFSYI